MKRLSGLDATFLHLESPEMPMHVGALHVFELPSGFKGKFVAALRQHMEGRLPLAPPLRRKLWMMPMNITSPVWVDAVPDLTQHIVEVKLPAHKAADETLAIEKMVGRLHANLIDRRRPLWKFHVIEGLAKSAGGRMRVYTQRDRTRLKLTLRGKRLGLSLQEVKELMDMYDSPRDTGPQLRKFLQVLSLHRAQLEQQMADLKLTLEEVKSQEAQARRLLKQTI